MVKIKEWITKLPREVFTISGAVIVILLAAIIFINTRPGNVAKRNIKYGDEAYNKGEFAEAAVYYEKAFSIDKSNEAVFYNLILSYMGYDMESAYRRYEDVMYIAANDFLNKEDVDMAMLCNIYLLAKEITYKDDFEKDRLYHNLAFGAERLSHNYGISDLMPALYDWSMQLGDECLAEGSYSDATYYYYWAIKTGLVDSETLSKIREVADKKFDKLLVDENFDGAVGFVRGTATYFQMDTEELMARYLKAWEFYKTKESLLSKAYDSMKFYYDLVGKDFSETNFDSVETVLSGMLSVGWTEMLELDGSEEAETVAKSLTKSAYVYAPDYEADYTGLGCGLYTYGDPVTDEEGNVHVKYYFYFGNYKDGVRDGYGFSFAESKDGSYRGFEGNWENDAPEGFGAEYISNFISKNSTAEYQSVIYGNYKNGVENGTMTALIRLTDAAEEIFKGTYEATDGVAPAVPTVTKDYELLTEVPEDQVVIAVMPSISKGYDIYNVLYEKTDNKLAALGF